MKTQQPVWKLIANLGDVNPIDYGGYFVLEDTTGVYDPEVICFEPLWEGAKDYAIVHRFSLEQCYAIGTDQISDNNYHKNTPAWFSSELKAAAECNGYDAAELIEELCSDNAEERAIGYRTIAEYHGYDNFDSYPLTFKTKNEAKVYLHESNCIVLDPYELFEAKTVDDLTALIEELKKDIRDDYRASDDPDDDTPAIQITIATDNDLSDWTYQTGDNSFNGGCYHYPHWSVNSIQRDTDAAELAAEMINDLTNTVAESNSYLKQSAE